MPILTESELLNRLRDECSVSSQKEVAKRLGISPQFLNDILKGKRAMSDKVLQGIEATPMPSCFVIRDRKWTKRDTKCLKKAWEGVWFGDTN